MFKINGWVIFIISCSFFTLVGQKCGLTDFNYESDSLGAHQYTFLSSCSEPCLFLEKKKNGVVFFCPGASVGGKIKKKIEKHKEMNKQWDYVFEITEENVPVYGVKIVFLIDAEKKFLLARTFTSVSGQQGLLIRCIDQDFLNSVHNKTPSKVRRYAYS